MQFTKQILSNGMRVITIPLKDNPTVTVLVMVSTGSEYEEKEQNGISHFLEHMCFKGTTKRPTTFDISRELDSLGAQYNAFTGQEFTGFYAKGRTGSFEKLLDVISDIYLNPVLDEKEIEKEKGVIIEEIHMYEDLPHKRVLDLFMGLLYGDTPAGWNIAGTETTVSKIGKKDFLAYREKHYVAEATTVVVAGHMDEQTVLEKVEAAFANIHLGEKEAKQKTVEAQSKLGLIVEFKESDQAHLVLGVRSFDVFSEYDTATSVLSSVLGGGMSSRLFQKLRSEMGIGYRLGCFQDSSADHGYFAVTAGVKQGRAGEAITAIIGEMKKLCNEKISDEELSRVKDHMTGMLFLELETSDSLAHFYGGEEVMRQRLKTPEEMAKEIQSVTPELLQQVAQMIFKNENLNCSIVGPLKDAKEIAPLLTF